MSDYQQGFAAALALIADWMDEDNMPSADFLRAEATRLRSSIDAAEPAMR